MRSAPTVRSLLVCLAFAIANLYSARADARRRGWTDEQAAEAGFGIELLEIEYGKLSPFIGNLTFEGDGQLNGAPAHLRVDGRDAGIVRPLLDAVTIHAITLRFKHWFMAGLQFGLQWGSLDGESAQQAAARGLDAALWGVGGGLHAGFVYSKSYFDLRADFDLGVRQYSISINAFDTETCHFKGASYPCEPSASGLQIYLQPSILAGVHLGRWFTVGAYGGIDVTSGVGWTAGGWLGFHAPFWSKDLMHVDDMQDRFN